MQFFQRFTRKDGSKNSTLGGSRRTSRSSPSPRPVSAPAPAASDSTDGSQPACETSAEAHDASSSSSSSGPEGPASPHGPNGPTALDAETIAAQEDLAHLALLLSGCRGSRGEQEKKLTECANAFLSTVEKHGNVFCPANGGTAPFGRPQVKELCVLCATRISTALQSVSASCDWTPLLESLYPFLRIVAAVLDNAGAGRAEPAGTGIRGTRGRLGGPESAVSWRTGVASSVTDTSLPGRLCDFLRVLCQYAPTAVASSDRRIWECAADVLKKLSMYPGSFGQLQKTDNLHSTLIVCAGPAEDAELGRVRQALRKVIMDIVTKDMGKGLVTYMHKRETIRMMVKAASCFGKESAAWSEDDPVTMLLTFATILRESQSTGIGILFVDFAMCEGYKLLADMLQWYDSQNINEEAAYTVLELAVQLADYGVSELPIPDLSDMPYWNQHIINRWQADKSMYLAPIRNLNAFRVVVQAFSFLTCEKTRFRVIDSLHRIFGSQPVNYILADDSETFRTLFVCLKSQDSEVSPELKKKVLDFIPFIARDLDCTPFGPLDSLARVIDQSNALYNARLKQQSSASSTIVKSTSSSTGAAITVNIPRTDSPPPSSSTSSVEKTSNPVDVLFPLTSMKYVLDALSEYMAPDAAKAKNVIRDARLIASLATYFVYICNICRADKSFSTTEPSPYLEAIQNLLHFFTVIIFKCPLNARALAQVSGLSLSMLWICSNFPKEAAKAGFSIFLDILLNDTTRTQKHLADLIEFIQHAGQADYPENTIVSVLRVMRKFVEQGDQGAKAAFRDSGGFDMLVTVLTKIQVAFSGLSEKEDEEREKLLHRCMREFHGVINLIIAAIWDSAENRSVFADFVGYNLLGTTVSSSGLLSDPKYNKYSTCLLTSFLKLATERFSLPGLEMYESLSDVEDTNPPTETTKEGAEAKDTSAVHQVDSKSSSTSDEDRYKTDTIVIRNRKPLNILLDLLKSAEEETVLTILQQVISLLDEDTNAEIMCSNVSFNNDDCLEDEDEPGFLEKLMVNMRHRILDSEDEAQEVLISIIDRVARRAVTASELRMLFDLVRTSAEEDQHTYELLLTLMTEVTAEGEDTPAVSFDLASDSCISEVCVDVPSSQVTSTSCLSISLWFRTHWLSDKSGGTDAPFYLFGLQMADLKSRMYCTISATGNVLSIWEGQRECIASAKVTVEPDKWHHVVFCHGKRTSRNTEASIFFDSFHLWTGRISLSPVWSTASTVTLSFGTPHAMLLQPHCAREWQMGPCFGFNRFLTPQQVLTLYLLGSAFDSHPQPGLDLSHSSKLSNLDPHNVEAALALPGAPVTTPTRLRNLSDVEALDLTQASWDISESSILWSISAGNSAPNTCVNTAVSNTELEAAPLSLYGTVRTFPSCPISSCLQRVGGVAVLLPLISEANTRTSLNLALNVLYEAIEGDAHNFHEMEAMQGYGLLVAILKQKAHLFDEAIVNTLFLFAGLDPERDPLDTRIIKCTSAFFNFFCTFEVWRGTQEHPLCSSSIVTPTALFRKVFEALFTLVSERNKYALFNANRMVAGSLVTRILMLLQEGFFPDTAAMDAVRLIEATVSLTMMPDDLCNMCNFTVALAKQLSENNFSSQSGCPSPLIGASSPKSQEQRSLQPSSRAAPSPPLLLQQNPPDASGSLTSSALNSLYSSSPEMTSGRNSTAGTPSVSSHEEFIGMSYSQVNKLCSALLKSLMRMLASGLSALSSSSPTAVTPTLSQQTTPGDDSDSSQSSSSTGPAGNSLLIITQNSNAVARAVAYSTQGIDMLINKMSCAWVFCFIRENLPPAIVATGIKILTTQLHRTMSGLQRNKFLQEFNKLTGIKEIRRVVIRFPNDPDIYYALFALMLGTDVRRIPDFAVFSLRELTNVFTSGQTIKTVNKDCVPIIIELLQKMFSNGYSASSMKSSSMSTRSAIRGHSPVPPTGQSLFQPVGQTTSSLSSAQLVHTPRGLGGPSASQTMTMRAFRGAKASMRDLFSIQTNSASIMTNFKNAEHAVLSFLQILYDTNSDFASCFSSRDVLEMYVPIFFSPVGKLEIPETGDSDQSTPFRVLYSLTNKMLVGSRDISFFSHLMLLAVPRSVHEKERVMLQSRLVYDLLDTLDTSLTKEVYFRDSKYFAQLFQWITSRLIQGKIYAPTSKLRDVQALYDAVKRFLSFLVRTARKFDDSIPKPVPSITAASAELKAKFISPSPSSTSGSASTGEKDKTTGETETDKKEGDDEMEGEILQTTGTTASTMKQEVLPLYQTMYRVVIILFSFTEPGRMFIATQAKIKAQPAVSSPIHEKEDSPATTTIDGTDITPSGDSASTEKKEGKTEEQPATRSKAEEEGGLKLSQAKKSDLDSMGKLGKRGQKVSTENPCLADRDVKLRILATIVSCSNVVLSCRSTTWDFGSKYFRTLMSFLYNWLMQEEDAELSSAAGCAWRALLTFAKREVVDGFTIRTGNKASDVTQVMSNDLAKVFSNDADTLRTWLKGEKKVPSALEGTIEKAANDWIAEEKRARLAVIKEFRRRNDSRQQKAIKDGSSVSNSSKLAKLRAERDSHAEKMIEVIGKALLLAKSDEKDRTQFTTTGWDKLLWDLRTSDDGVWSEAKYNLYPKWRLDFTEGPFRIRRRFQRDYTFFERFPYRPDLESAEEKERTKGKTTKGVPSSLDSKQYAIETHTYVPEQTAQTSSPSIAPETVEEASTPSSIKLATVPQQAKKTGTTRNRSTSPRPSALKLNIDLSTDGDSQGKGDEEEEETKPVTPKAQKPTEEEMEEEDGDEEEEVLASPSSSDKTDETRVPRARKPRKSRQTGKTEIMRSTSTHLSVTLADDSTTTPSGTGRELSAGPSGNSSIRPESLSPTGSDSRSSSEGPMAMKEMRNSAGSTIGGTKEETANVSANAATFSRPRCATRKVFVDLGLDGGPKIGKGKSRTHESLPEVQAIVVAEPQISSPNTSSLEAATPEAEEEEFNVPSDGESDDDDELNEEGPSVRSPLTQGSLHKEGGKAGGMKGSNTVSTGAGNGEEGPKSEWDELSETSEFDEEDTDTGFEEDDEQLYEMLESSGYSRNKLLTAVEEREQAMFNNRLERFFEPGDTVLQMFSCSVAEAMDTRKGILAICKKNVYIVMDFALTANGEIEDIKSEASSKAGFELRQVHSCITWNKGDIREVVRRRYTLQWIALEVFLAYGESTLLVFSKEDIDAAKKALRSIADATPMFSIMRMDVDLSCSSNVGAVRSIEFTKSTSNDPVSALIESIGAAAGAVGGLSADVSGQGGNGGDGSADSSVDIPKGSVGGIKQATTVVSSYTQLDLMTQLWVEGKVSNFQYLLYLNSVAGRSYSDISQYPVFPWIIADYKSDTLNLTDEHMFRDLSKPIGALTSAREAVARQKYQDCIGVVEPYNYGVHYSSSASVVYYLVRMEPFTRPYLDLSAGNWDWADRLFQSVDETWSMLMDSKSREVMELTPEFFYLPEFLINENHFYFGNLESTGKPVNDVVLPPWAHGSPREFVRKNMEALESPYVSRHLNEWIDLIFGYKQRGPEAVRACNVFEPHSYEGSVDLDSLTDDVERASVIGRIRNFGQTPLQIWSSGPHPARSKAACEIPSPPPWTTTPSSVVPQTVLTLPSHEPVAAIRLPAPDRTAACPRGRLFVSLAHTSRQLSYKNADQSVRLWQGDKLQGVWYPCPGAVVTCAASADDGSCIAVGSSDTVVRLYAPLGPSDKTLSLSAELSGHRARVTALTVSRNHGIAVSGAADGVSIVWDTHKKHKALSLAPVVPIGKSGRKGGRASQAKLLRTRAVVALDVHITTGDIAVCTKRRLSVFSLSGELLATTEIDSNGGKTLGRGGQQSGTDITCCRFSHEWIPGRGQVLLTGHSDGTLRVWDTENFESPSTPEGNETGRKELPTLKMKFMLFTGEPAAVTHIFIPYGEKNRFFVGNANGNVIQMGTETKKK